MIVEPNSAPTPDFCYIRSANSHGKEAFAVKHVDSKAASGIFLLYKYNDVYTFGKKEIENAVRLGYTLKLTLFQHVSNTFLNIDKRMPR